MSAPHEDIKLLLGAYVLGGLDQADLREVQDHLPTCATCRDELAALAVLPGLMRRRRDDDATASTPAAPPQLLPALLRQVDVERRRDRLHARGRLAVAAVTVAALTAGAGAVLSRDAGSGSQVSFAVTAGSATSGQASLLAKPWGTAITVDLAGLPRTGRFVLRTTSRDGTSEQAATWAATANGVARVVGATSISTADVTEVAVLGPSGQPVSVATPAEIPNPSKAR